MADRLLREEDPLKISEKEERPIRPVFPSTAEPGPAALPPAESRWNRAANRARSAARQTVDAARRQFGVIRGGGGQGVNTEELKARVQRGLERARIRARYWQVRARDYAQRNPLHVAGGALVAGALLGALLRIRRSNRA